jgi:molecular chaperone DnaK
MAYQLGIDLGTTYTAAAVRRSSDRRWVEPEVVTLGTRGATIPSVLFIAPDGSVVVGDAAERRALTDPGRVVREFKRRIGDSTPVVVAGRAWAPEELSARLVRWVVDRVAEREGGPADRIAITHPASWGQHKKDLLGSALAGQGLTVTFLAEPQAAALHYAAAERVGTGSTIAVYDLGGGTFDAALVRKGDSSGAAGFGLLGRPEGLERLGGIDFDEVVFEHVRNGMPDAFNALDETDPAVLSAVARLRRDCTEAKEALSSDTEVAIPVMLPAARGSVRLHRSEFEAMIRRQVEETVTALRAAVGSAGLAPEQLTAVLLVGGSSRIPLVGQLVSEQLGRPVAVDADPKNAIAKGAALAVSPQPTVSWPGVSIPPVPAGGGQAGGPPMGAAMGAPMAAPPPRPPLPSLPQNGGLPNGNMGGDTPPNGTPRHGHGGPAGPQRAIQPAAAYAPQRERVSHEPSNTLMSNTTREPRREQQEPDWDYATEEPRRRPSGLLIGVGGVVAVAAVIAAVVFWPRGSDSPTVGTDAGSSGSSTTEAAPPAQAPAAGGGGSGDSGSTGRATTPPASTGSASTSRPGSGSGTEPTDDAGSDETEDPGTDGGSEDPGNDEDSGSSSTRDSSSTEDSSSGSDTPATGTSARGAQSDYISPGRAGSDMPGIADGATGAEQPAALPSGAPTPEI